MSYYDSNYVLLKSSDDVMTSAVNHQGSSVFGNAIAKLKVSRLVFSNSVGIVNRA